MEIDRLRDWVLYWDYQSIKSSVGVFSDLRIFVEPRTALTKVQDLRLVKSVVVP